MEMVLAWIIGVGSFVVFGLVWFGFSVTGKALQILWFEENPEVEYAGSGWYGPLCTIRTKSGAKFSMNCYPQQIPFIGKNF